MWIQVGASGALVAGVLWWMWRLPRRGEAMLAVAPVMALGSVWLGLAGVGLSLGLWWVTLPDWLVAVVLLVFDPASIAAGVLVLWAYRGDRSGETTVWLQRQQAWVGIGLGLAAVAVGYWYVMTHKPLFTPVGV